jgi:hypothetical protein
MKKLLIGLLLTLPACAPQQTHIVTEYTGPDGSKYRYENRSNGFGYNPNFTSENYRRGANLTPYSTYYPYYYNTYYYGYGGGYPVWYGW